MVTKTIGPLIAQATEDGSKLVENDSKYVIISIKKDEVNMEIGLVRLDGVREVPHATRVYYQDGEGEVKYLTHAHS